MFDLNCPAVRNAQHIANATGETHVLVPNFIGGIDIKPGHIIGADEIINSKVLAVVTPVRNLAQQNN